MFKTNFIVVTAFFLAGSVMQASSFTVFNTGEGQTITSNPSFGIIDTNWTINGGDAFVTDNSGYPFPTWVADNLPLYAWISPQQSYTGGETDAPGTYTYTTTFDLTGFDPTTANLQFEFAVDNNVISVSLNGNEVPGISGGSFGLSAVQDINSGFVAGVNTLTFTVQNFDGATNNPTGLLVDFTSATADPIGSAVPEPATTALMGVSLIGIAFLRRKR